MQLLPIPLRFALLSSVALMVSLPSMHGDCSGDQYWDADPEGTLTWFTRSPDIPMHLALPQVVEAVRSALQNAGLPVCDNSERDLLSQKVKVVRAFQAEKLDTRIPDKFNANIRDCSQVMVRIIDRDRDGYAVQILTRSKWARGDARPSHVADQERRCAASAIANKVRSHLTPLSR